MKITKPLAAIAALFLITSCSPAQMDRATEVTPLTQVVVEASEVAVPEGAAVSFEAVESVTVVPAADPIAADFVEVVTPAAEPSYVVQQPAPAVVEVSPSTPAAALPEYAPEPTCYQDEPCWDCKDMGNFCEDPKEVVPTPEEDTEYADSPTCYQDEPCWDCEAMGTTCDEDYGKQD